jgi:hypothetical protein
MQEKQNLTISLERGIIQKARILAAQRGTSISQLLSSYLETLVREESRYQAAHQQALELLDAGFDLGGRIRCSRDDWHER